MDQVADEVMGEEVINKKRQIGREGQAEGYHRQCKCLVELSLLNYSWKFCCDTSNSVHDGRCGEEFSRKVVPREYTIKRMHVSWHFQPYHCTRQEIMRSSADNYTRIEYHPKSFRCCKNTAFYTIAVYCFYTGMQ